MRQQDLHKTKPRSESKKFRLTDFFNAHWTKYVKNPSEPIKPEHFKAVNAIRNCRTEVLGKRIYLCPKCGDVSETFHSCKRDRDAENKAKEKTLTLHYRDFFPRLLQHVPPPGFQIIRYYGLYSNANKIKAEYTRKPDADTSACTACDNPKLFKIELKKLCVPLNT